MTMSAHGRVINPLSTADLLLPSEAMAGYTHFGDRYDHQHVLIWRMPLQIRASYER